jgi:glycerol-3-phosphate cytidylyltransferase
MIVITFGTFDILHIGHINILRRARAMGERLVVGVSSDKLNFAKKGRYPVYPQAERCELVGVLRYVDEVFLEESLERKREYIERYHADVLVMGDDWQGRFDSFSDICRVVYLPRTPSISTTSIIEIVKSSPGR